MKNESYLLLTSLFLCSQVYGHTDTEVDTSKTRFSLATGVGTGDPYLTTVNSTQFTTGGSLVQTYTISSAGLYTFVGDIAYAATGANDATTGRALYINSDNVVIDLNGRTLFNNNGDDSNTLNGIEIALGKHNITIKNGGITGWGLQGIKVGSSCSDIKFENITISNCGGCGVYLVGGLASEVSGVIFDNCRIFKISAEAGADSAGLQIDFGNNIIIKNTTISDVLAPNDQVSRGIYISTGTGIQCNNCFVSDIGGQDAYGIDGSTLVGSTFENCTVTGCFALTKTCAGYQIAGTGNILKNCISSSNEGVSNGYGFYLTSANYNTLLDCYAYDCSNYAETGSWSAGFYATGSNGNVFIDCQSVGNQTVNSLLSYVAGFALVGTSGQNSFQNCIAQANGSSAKAGNAYGFYFGHATTVDYNSVRACQALSNVCSSTGAAKGFYDISTTSTTNMFLDNFAFGNTNTSTTDNFDVTVTGTFPESEGSIGGVNAISGKPIYYNVSITS